MTHPKENQSGANLIRSFPSRANKILMRAALDYKGGAAQKSMHIEMFDSRAKGKNRGSKALSAQNPFRLILPCRVLNFFNQNFMHFDRLARTHQHTCFKYALVKFLKRCRWVTFVAHSSVTALPPHRVLPNRPSGSSETR